MEMSTSVGALCCYFVEKPFILCDKGIIVTLVVHFISGHRGWWHAIYLPVCSKALVCHKNRKEHNLSIIGPVNIGNTNQAITVPDVIASCSTRPLANTNLITTLDMSSSRLI